MATGRRDDSDFKNEIDAHIRLEMDRLIADGMSPSEAHAAARRTFGNVAIVREKFYDSQHRLWWDRLAQDLRYGLRSLRKAPGFTAAATLTIALGVGANTAIFSLMEAVLLRSLPVQNPKELVFLQVAGSAGASGAPPYPCFAQLRDETRSFTGMAAFSSDELRIDIDGIPEQVMGQVASGDYFEVLKLRPALGRLMNASDEKLNPPVAVISDQYWRRRFGGDPAVLGKTISYGERTFSIVGVTPPEFRGLQPGTSIDVTLPITIEQKYLTDSGSWWIQAIIARLKPGVSGREAQAESDVVFQSFMSGSRYPADLIRKHFHHLEAGPAAHGMDALRRRFSKPLFVLMGIVALVLLMAIANIANLLLARGISRRSEFAIRLATGAGRMRLTRQLLTETLLLFAFGAIPGVLFAGWGVGVIGSLFAQGRRAITLDTDLNWRVLIFSLLVALGAGLLAGLVPAWRAFRTDPAEAIKEGQTRTTESRTAGAMTRSLVSFQVALSLVLLVGAVTFVRTLLNLRNVDPGFQNEPVLTMSIRLPEGYGQVDRSIAFWSRALEAIRGIPGVYSAGFSTFTPLSGRDRGAVVRIRGYEAKNHEDATIRVNQISEGYLETLGIPLVRGRRLTDQDAAGSLKVALINESAARKYFGERDPIGESLEFSRSGAPHSAYRIVGVVRDTKHMNLREQPPRFAFIPIRQPKDAEARMTLIVASTSPNALLALMRPIQSRISTIEPGVLVSDVITMRRQIDSTLLAERLLSGLSGAFGVLAVILSAVGLYGVLSYRIGQQRRSIGIRMALGASRFSVAWSVLRQSGVLIAAGLLAGLPFAILAARAADSMTWGVKSSDPIIYVAAAAVLCLTGLASAYLPARRASTIDPADALRHD